METVSDSHGDDRHLRIRGGGAVLGWSALVGRPLESIHVALTQMELCIRPANAVLEWAHHHRGSAATLLSLAIDDLCDQADTQAMLRGSAECRLARLLLARRRYRREHEEFAIEQRLLARLLDIRPETLSRCLRRFRELGLIEPTGLQTTGDTGQLEHLAGE